MLELTDGVIREQQGFAGNIVQTTMNGQWYNNTSNCYPYQQTSWYSYPVYICSDKTAKAIAVLKALEAQKQIKVASVSKFIELVEQIAGLL